ncbi:CsbD family protein [Methylobacterium nigriterrae]|uniref:CsbD family protein n=1 Tax=Methylobacterium nigriterrae TaxID=3127512 RepID=UPI003D66E89E
MAVEKNQDVDPDRVEGSAKNLGGKIKEGAGKLLGDEKLKNEGRVDQVKGKVQNAVGSVKDALKGK